ncbi:hypothetical protein FRB98_008530 [Tulasnella sp. 332]|nr:hypothetical protein FRB98_008530 [Tulasnella sp. 332]
MHRTSGQRSFAVGAIPLCGADKILIRLHSKSIKLTDWERIAPDDHRDPKLLRNGFIGVIIAVGPDVMNGSLRTGDAVAGFADGGWVDTVDGGNIEYLNAQPDNVPDGVMDIGMVHGMAKLVVAKEPKGSMSPITTTARWKYLED